MTSLSQSGQEFFLASAIGEEEGTSGWMLVDQQRINDFAEVTEDRQFIHVDPEACAERSPYGVPIAHGFLTLSLLGALVTQIPTSPQRSGGLTAIVNYGFGKVRFLNPVRVNSRIRARSVLAAVALKDASSVQVTRTVTVEIDGESKPALVADWIVLYVYA